MVNRPLTIDGCLFVTRCSRCKAHIERGTPSELYRGTIPQYFFRAMNQLKLRYAVLSDKHGLHIDSETLAAYDLHPSALNDLQKMALARIIKAKALGLGSTRIIFYNNSPLQSVPYFQMLFYSGLETYFCTRLNVMDGHKQEHA